MYRIVGTKYAPNSDDKVLLHDLPIGAQFEYCGEPYIKIDLRKIMPHFVILLVK